MDAYKIVFFILTLLAFSSKAYNPFETAPDNLNYQELLNNYYLSDPDDYQDYHNSNGGGFWTGGKFDGVNEDRLAIFPVESTGYIDDDCHYYDKMMILSRDGSVPGIVLDHGFFDANQESEIKFTFPIHWFDLVTIHTIHDSSNEGGSSKDLLLIEFRSREVLYHNYYVLRFNDSEEWEIYTPKDPRFLNFDKCNEYWSDWHEETNNKYRIFGRFNADTSDYDIQPINAVEIALFPIGNLHINNCGWRIGNDSEKYGDSFKRYIIKSSPEAYCEVVGEVENMHSIKDSDGCDLLILSFKNSPLSDKRHLVIYKIKETTYGNDCETLFVNGEKLNYYNIEPCEIGFENVDSEVWEFEDYSDYCQRELERNEKPVMRDDASQ